MGNGRDKGDDGKADDEKGSRDKPGDRPRMPDKVTKREKQDYEKSDREDD